MKSPIANRKSLLIMRPCRVRGILCSGVFRAGLYALTMLVAACGQRGPLYLPDQRATTVEQPAQPASQSPHPDALPQGENGTMPDKPIDAKEEQKKDD